MSSGLWKKNDNEPGLFGGGQNKGLWSSPGHDSRPLGFGGESAPGTGQDALDPTAKDTGGGFDHEWEKMEEKYNEAFDKSADLNEPPFSRYYPYGQKNKYEPLLPEENQQEATSFSDTFNDVGDSEENEATGDNSGANGGSSGTAQPYREEEQQITNVRRGGHKRLRNKLFSINRYAKRNRKGRKIPDISDVLNRHKKEGKGNAQANHGAKDIPLEEENDSLVGEPPRAEEYEKFSQEVDKERLRLEKLGPSKVTLEARKATADFFKFMYADYGEDQTEEDDYDSDNDNDHENESESIDDSDEDEY